MIRITGPCDDDTLTDMVCPACARTAKRSSPGVAVLPCTVAVVPPGWNWIRRRAGVLADGTAVGNAGAVAGVVAVASPVGDAKGVGSWAVADGKGRGVTTAKGVGDALSNEAHPVANTVSNVHTPSRASLQAIVSQGVVTVATPTAGIAP